MYKRANSIMAFNIMYSFSLFEAGKPKREWGNNFVLFLLITGHRRENFGQGFLSICKAIKKLALKHNLKVIEDSADTLGAKINNKPTGVYSDISITSFYGSHVISCAGNGGMFLTDDKKLHDKAKVLRSWGRMSTLIKDSENIKKRLGIKLKGFDYDRKFVFSEAGYNFEPSEIGASFGLEQLKKFNFFTKIRNRNFKLPVSKLLREARENPSRPDGSTSRGFPPKTSPL